MRRTTWIIVATAAAAAAAWADNAKKAEVEEVRAALNELKEQKLEDILQLPRDENDAFIMLYNKWEETRWGYAERRDGLLDELRTAVVTAPVAGGSGGRPLTEILDDIDANDENAATAEVKLRADFRAILSTDQYAKLLLFEHNFNKNLRKLVQERQRWEAAGEPAPEK